MVAVDADAQRDNLLKFTTLCKIAVSQSEEDLREGVSRLATILRK